MNEKCLRGELSFRFIGDSIELSLEKESRAVFNEFDALSANKTKEASVFRIVKEITEKLNLIQSPYRIFGNKRIFSKGEKYYVFPRILYNPIQTNIYYEIVNTTKLV